MTTVIASVGYPGAGKSTISDWMRKRNIPVVSMGDILRNRFDQADVDKLKQDRKNSDGI
jgi:dephospho-CoA kinase